MQRVSRALVRGTVALGKPCPGVCPSYSQVAKDWFMSLPWVSRPTLFAIFTLLLLTPSASQAQDLGGSGGQGGRIEGSYKIVPLPYFNYNRSIGASLGWIHGPTSTIQGPDS